MAPNQRPSRLTVSECGTVRHCQTERQGQVYRSHSQRDTRHLLELKQVGFALELKLGGFRLFERGGIPYLEGPARVRGHDRMVRGVILQTCEEMRTGEEGKRTARAMSGAVCRSFRMCSGWLAPVSSYVR
jgi:hypothetical protein